MRAVFALLGLQREKPGLQLPGGQAELSVYITLERLPTPPNRTLKVRPAPRAQNNRRELAQVPLAQPFQACQGGVQRPHRLLHLEPEGPQVRRLRQFLVCQRIHLLLERLALLRRQVLLQHVVVEAWRARGKRGRRRWLVHHLRWLLHEVRPRLGHLHSRLCERAVLEALLTSVRPPHLLQRVVPTRVRLLHCLHVRWRRRRGAQKGRRPWLGLWWWRWRIQVDVSADVDGVWRRRIVELGEVGLAGCVIGVHTWAAPVTVESLLR